VISRFRIHTARLVRIPQYSEFVNARQPLGRFVVGACRASLLSSLIAHWMIFQ